MKGSKLVKKSLIVLLAAASPLFAGTALAQGSGRNVTVFRMSGPQLGVRLVEVDKDAVTRLKLKEEKGALVTEVVEDSAAEKAGLKTDDVIVRYQGESVLTAAQLGRLVRDTPAGRKVKIDVIRAGAPVQVAATLEKAHNVWNEGEGPHIVTEALTEKLGKLRELRFKSREGDGPEVFDFKMDKDLQIEMEKEGGDHNVFRYRMNKNGPTWIMERDGRGRLGITYTEIEGQLAKYFSAPAKTAVLVNSVVEGSAAEKAGIKAGDLMTGLGGAKVSDGSDLQEAVRKLEAGKKTPLTVWRGGASVELSVTLEEAKLREKKAPRTLKPVS